MRETFFVSLSSVQKSGRPRRAWLFVTPTSPHSWGPGWLVSTLHLSLLSGHPYYSGLLCSIHSTCTRSRGLIL